MFLRVFLLFLLVLNIFQNLLLFSALEIRKRIIKFEVKKSILMNINKDDLVTLKFQTDQLKFLEWEHENEFKYKDQMYDIISRLDFLDSVMFICFPDDEETEIKKLIKETAVSAFKNDPLKNDIVAKYYNLKFNSNYIFKLFNIDLSSALSEVKYYSSNYPLYKIHLKPITPPPKII